MLTRTLLWPNFVNFPHSIGANVGLHLNIDIQIIPRKLPIAVVEVLLSLQMIKLHDCLKLLYPCPSGNSSICDQWSDNSSIYQSFSQQPSTLPEAPFSKLYLGK